MRCASFVNFIIGKDNYYGTYFIEANVATAEGVCLHIDHPGGNCSNFTSPPRGWSRAPAIPSRA